MMLGELLCDFSRGLTEKVARQSSIIVDFRHIPSTGLFCHPTESADS